MNIVLLGLLIMVTACIGPGDISKVTSQGDEQFPKLTGIDLFGQERVLPDTFVGRRNLVAVAFEREHQVPVNTWIAEADRLMRTHNDLKFYEIPLIYSMSAMSRMWVNNGMRAGIVEDKARERTITVYTDRDQFTELMQMQTDRIYVLLLDDRGRILWRTEGPVNQQSLAALEQFLNQ